MCLEVRTVRGRIVAETRCLDDVLQHAAYVAINVSDAEFAVLHTIDNLLSLCRLSRFHEVVASLNLGNGGQPLADANPVGHHDTLVAPVLAQYLCQQVVVAHRELTVDFVVR